MVFHLKGNIVFYARLINHTTASRSAWCIEVNETLFADRLALPTEYYICS